MNYEEKYYELREAVDRAFDTFCKEVTMKNWEAYQVAEKRFAGYCIGILEKLMEENSDVLARLK